MVGQKWLPVVVGTILVGSSLTACSNEVDQAVDQATGIADKASACTKALGITASFDPENISPQELKQKATQKSEQVRDLAEQVTDGELKESLFSIADGYVKLKQKESEGLSGLNDWIQRNADNLDRLRQICL